MQPTHDPNKVVTHTFRHDCEMYGRSWVTSSQKKGDFMNTPGAAKLITHPSYKNQPQQTSELTRQIQAQRSGEDSCGLQPVRSQDTDRTITDHPSAVLAMAGNSAALSYAQEVLQEEQASRYAQSSVAGSLPVTFPGTGMDIDDDQASEAHSLGSQWRQPSQDSGPSRSLMGGSQSDVSKTSSNTAPEPPMHKSIASLKSHAGHSTTSISPSPIPESPESLSELLPSKQATQMDASMTGTYKLASRWFCTA